VRLALISDIHGNALALSAVLDEIEQEGVDEIVCLGDVVHGPQTPAVLARLRELGCPIVMGNWDAWFLDGIPPLGDEVGRRLVDIGNWWADALSDADRAFIRTFRRTVEVPLPGGTSMLCFHGSPRSFSDEIFPGTADADIEPMLAGCRSPVLAGGHTHVAMARRLRDSVLVNPGSVGLPFRRWHPHPVRIGRWTEYAVVTGLDDRLSIDLRRTSFDADEFLRLSRRSGMPHASWWIGTWADP
jgi:predicted phosphodiesterase